MRRYGLLTGLALAALTCAGAPAPSEPPDEPPETGDYHWIGLPGKGPLLVLDGELMVVHTGPKIDSPQAPKDANDLPEREVSADPWLVTGPLGGRRGIVVGG